MMTLEEFKATKTKMKTKKLAKMLGLKVEEVSTRKKVFVYADRFFIEKEGDRYFLNLFNMSYKGKNNHKTNNLNYLEEILWNDFAKSELNNNEETHDLINKLEKSINKMPIHKTIEIIAHLDELRQYINGNITSLGDKEENFHLRVQKWLAENNLPQQSLDEIDRELMTEEQKDEADEFMEEYRELIEA